MQFKLVEPNSEQSKKQQESIASTQPDTFTIEISTNNSAINSNKKLFYTTDLSLTIRNQTYKRKLTNCDLCSFTCITNSITDNNKYMKVHLLDKHLVLSQNYKYTIKNNSNVDPEIINLMENILFNLSTIDNSNNKYLFKCSACSSTFKSKIQLKRHVLNSCTAPLARNDIDKLQCVYCLRLYTNINDLIGHLKQDHRNKIQDDYLLLSYPSIDDESALDMNEYFMDDLLQFDEDDAEDNDSSNGTKNNNSNDNSDDENSNSGSTNNNNKAKLKIKPKQVSINANGNNNSNNNKSMDLLISAPVSGKTWTCQMCKKQFDQRVELSKHQCIELHLKLLKKKKEMRKKNGEKLTGSVRLI